MHKICIFFVTINYPAIGRTRTITIQSIVMIFPKRLSKSPMVYFETLKP
jgi:hypothetical protein